MYSMRNGKEVIYVRSGEDTLELFKILRKLIKDDPKIKTEKEESFQKLSTEAKNNIERLCAEQDAIITEHLDMMEEFYQDHSNNNVISNFAAHLKRLQSLFSHYPIQTICLKMPQSIDDFYEKTKFNSVYVIPKKKYESVDIEEVNALRALYPEITVKGCYYFRGEVETLRVINLLKTELKLETRITKQAFDQLEIDAVTKTAALEKNAYQGLAFLTLKENELLKDLLQLESSCLTKPISNGPSKINFYPQFAGVFAKSSQPIRALYDELLKNYVDPLFAEEALDFAYRLKNAIEEICPQNKEIYEMDEKGEEALYLVSNRRAEDATELQMLESILTKVKSEIAKMYESEVPANFYYELHELFLKKDYSFARSTYEKHAMTEAKIFQRRWYTLELAEKGKENLDSKNEQPRVHAMPAHEEMPQPTQGKSSQPSSQGPSPQGTLKNYVSWMGTAVSSALSPKLTKKGDGKNDKNSRLAKNKEVESDRTRHSFN